MGPVHNSAAFYVVITLLLPLLKPRPTAGASRNFWVGTYLGKVVIGRIEWGVFGYKCGERQVERQPRDRIIIIIR